MQHVYICDFLRTAVGKYDGALSRIRPDDLGAIVIRGLIDKHPHLADVIDEVVFGCANQAGEDNRNVARMSLLLAGLPASIPGYTVNRLCASGLDAVASAARSIMAEESELIIAGGVESMSRAPFVLAKAERAFQRSAEIFDTTIGWRFPNNRMRELYGVDTMPETAENVALEHAIPRDAQDRFALRSQQRAVKAQHSGFLAQSIIPVPVPVAKGQTLQFGQDEQIRGGTTLEGLSKLRPIVRADGTVTAGNASGINDGAAGLLLASESAVSRHRLKPVARIKGFASAGVLPRIMGVGPIPAINRLLAKHGVEITDMSVVELNEAFASQALACLRGLGIPDDAEHVNPNGGAIALGHPLGMSGARIAGFASQELATRGGRHALAAMCVGVGQGAALLLERP